MENITDNITTAIPLLTEKDTLPVLGLPGMVFYMLHVTALFSLTISITSSISVFIILRPTCPNFWSRSAGERLVIYLATVDLCFSLSHLADHSTMLILKNHPPHAACSVMGWVVMNFIFVQALLVTFTALNAYMLIVREKKISLGKYDWRLLVAAYLPPGVFMSICAGMDWLGAGGAWCAFNARKPAASILYLSVAITNILVIMINIFAYISIYFKIKEITKATQAIGNTTNASNKSRVKTGSTMMKFVAAYILQYFSVPVYSIWGVITDPPIIFTFMIIFIMNLGGMFNLIVYTLVRNIGKTKPKKGHTNPQNTASVSTLSLSVDRSSI